MRAATLVAAALLASGCSLIVDADRFRGLPPGDAGPFDAAIGPDGGPAEARDAGPARDGGVDGSEPDGGVRDAGLDSGVRDAGVDSGVRDAGPGPDGSVRDAGPGPDGGVRDAGPGPDGSVRDAGTRDAGFDRDGGTIDAGTPVDAGTRDGGSRDGGTIDAGARDGGVPQIIQIIVPGAGSLEEGRSGVPIFVIGDLLPPQGSVVVAEPGVQVVSARVNAAGTRAAAVLDVDVDTMLGDGTPRTVTVMITDGPASASGTVSLVGRDELDISANTTRTTLRARYSRITVAAGATLTLATPSAARLVANGDVTLSGTIRGNGATNRTPGPGACAGGAGRTAGGCGVSGGGEGRAGLAPLVNTTGGGGGGNRTPGQAGGGNVGAGGDVNVDADPLLIPLDDHHGHGGGGGQGQYGAGGGGVVELTTLGHLTMSGALEARGGDGVDFSTGLGCIGGGAAGGGGSGGAILLRARSTSFTSATIDVSGGDGGSANGCSGGGGGAGGHGFLRLDLPSTPVVGALATTPATGFVLGPMWAERQTVLVAPGSIIELEVTGASGQTFAYEIDGGGRSTIVIPGSGTAMVPAILNEGLHEICLIVGAGAGVLSEERNCRRLVAL